jgi:hypothetical protein
MKIRFVVACLAVTGLLIGCAANTDSEPTDDTSEAQHGGAAGGGVAAGPFIAGVNCNCPFISANHHFSCILPPPGSIEVCVAAGAAPVL